MKRCKATVWYRDEIQNGQNKGVKGGNNSAGGGNKKGRYMIHWAERPVPDNSGLDLLVQPTKLLHRNLPLIGLEHTI